MKAMILAAGLGQRMRPLTDHLPKPLLTVGGKPLLQYHLENLRDAGIHQVVINLSYLGERIREWAGDGSRFGLQIEYSEEPEPLETGGALLHAMPLLGTAPVLLVNADVWTDLRFTDLLSDSRVEKGKGHLVMVPNPDFHPAGDFYLSSENARLCENGKPDQRFTFGGISILSPGLINEYPERRRKFPLVEVFRAAIAAGALTGEVYRGGWSDVGTPERLRDLDELLQSASLPRVKV